MPTALFYNFSDFEFTGSWGGEHQVFAPKEKTYMPAFLAQHFAKHLVNRELHRKGLDFATSPKEPEDQPEFNKLFRIAYVRDRDVAGKPRNGLKDIIDSVNLNRQGNEREKVVAPGVNTLGADVEPKQPPREPSPQEDPDYTAENPDSKLTPPKGVVEVSVPDDEDDDDGYEDGVDIKSPEVQSSGDGSVAVTS